MTLPPTSKAGTFLGHSPVPSFYTASQYLLTSCQREPRTAGLDREPGMLSINSRTLNGVLRGLPRGHLRVTQNGVRPACPLAVVLC